MYMLIAVVHEDGQCETIRLIPPVEAKEGKHLNRITCANGTEYFFTKDGYYDGWGRPVNDPNDTLEVFV